MKTSDLRKKYLEFFENKGHKLFASDSLVPEDESVLFTSAGMNQFKPYFLGEKKDAKRAVSCQKCLRTGDLDRVGKTAYHHTFFEMLGNFSFGDYFKKEAIEFAWEFMTKTLNMNTKDLWVSVYLEDSQAYDIWDKHIGVEPSRIVKLGAKDNFWPSNAPIAGPNGPCGPCSEIFYDWGENVGCRTSGCSPACSCGRFVEVWNLVFTQFNRIGKNELIGLPQKNIDTGMGLERMANVLQQKGNNFEIDSIKPLVCHVREKLKIKDDDKSHNNLIYAIVDHGRAATFSVADGVFPSNEDKGYVIRKLIRKAFWYGFSLGVKKPFIYELVGLVACENKYVYPDIFDNQKRISDIIYSEEERFLTTVKDAKVQLQNVIGELKESNATEVSGDVAFKLYDTHGLPLDLTQEMAMDAGLTVNEKSFYEHMTKQKENSRKQSMFKDSIFSKEDYNFDECTEFLGYHLCSKNTQISKILKSKNESDLLKAGEEGAIVLEETPFYPESGGQLTDKGFLRSDTGLFSVDYVQKANKTIIHIGRVTEGTIKKGACLASVDIDRRRSLMRAHTATHLLQAALRQVLGQHVAQQGSMVDVDRLRFDFTHPKALSHDEIIAIEETVNNLIVENLVVDKKTMPLVEAKKSGALAFFKDKYQEDVRVVSISDASKEFCGGTHIDSTSEIGGFLISSESSISSGIRRIEALTGKEFFKKFSGYKNTIKTLSGVLKTEESTLVDTTGVLLDSLKGLKDKISKIEKEQLLSRHKGKTSSFIEGPLGIKIYVESFENETYDGLLHLCDIIRQEGEPSFVFFVSSGSDKNIFVCSVSKSVDAKGVSPQKFIKKFKNDFGLKGGGRGLAAQGVLTENVDLSILKEKIMKFISDEVSQ